MLQKSLSQPKKDKAELEQKVKELEAKVADWEPVVEEVVEEAEAEAA